MIIAVSKKIIKTADKSPKKEKRKDNDNISVWLSDKHHYFEIILKKKKIESDILT